MGIFKIESGSVATVAVLVNGGEVYVPVGASVAAAVLLAGHQATRNSPVDLSPRAPYCLMGVCFECLMTIDGVPGRQACMMSAEPGMVIECGSLPGDAK